jgi:hypothetical protein
LNVEADGVKPFVEREDGLVKPLLVGSVTKRIVDPG